MDTPEPVGSVGDRTGPTRPSASERDRKNEILAKDGKLRKLTIEELLKREGLFTGRPSLSRSPQQRGRTMSLPKAIRTFVCWEVDDEEDVSVVEPRAELMQEKRKRKDSPPSQEAKRVHTKTVAAISEESTWESLRAKIDRIKMITTSLAKTVKEHTSTNVEIKADTAELVKSVQAVTKLWARVNLKEDLTEGDVEVLSRKNERLKAGVIEGEAIAQSTIENL